MYPPKFGYVIPENLNEALEFLEEHPDAKPLAGGQSLIRQLKLRQIRPSYLVEIRRLPLDYIRKEGNIYKIGALTTHYTLSKSQIPLLNETASKTADPQVRNMGTIGGVVALMHPATDNFAALIAMDAKVKITSRKQERIVDFSSFQKGRFKADLSPGELVTEIQIPTFEGYKFSYQKLAKRIIDHPIVGVGVLVKLSGDTIEDIRIGITGASDVPAVRAKGAEEELLGKRINDEIIEKAANRAMESVNPASDLVASAEYRKKMVKVLTKKAILNALKR